MMTEENPLTAFSEKITKVYLVPDFLEVSRTTIERVVSEFQYPFADLDFLVANSKIDRSLHLVVTLYMICGINHTMP